MSVIGTGDPGTGRKFSIRSHCGEDEGICLWKYGDKILLWTYKPYLLNGEVVEVQTQVNVVFSLKP